MGSLTIAVYARHRGCTPWAVRKALRDGRITREADGLIDPERADRDWQRNTSPARRPHGGVPSQGSHPRESVDFAQARARKEEALAGMAEMELAEKQGKLLPRELIERTWLKFAMACRAGLLAMPRRLAPRLASESRAAVCEELLRDAVHEALTEIASVDGITVRRGPPKKRRTKS